MKQNILKHTFAAGLAVLCVAAYAPALGNTGLFNTAVTASAETLTNGNYEYTLLNNGTVEITKYIGEDTKLTIPSEIGGKAVKSIGDGAFKYCRTLTSITIPNSVTSISDWAFYECSYLTNVIIPNSVVSIGKNAFNGCMKLASVNIPDSVTDIGDHAFAYCESIKSITIPKNVKSIGIGVFDDCSSLTSFSVDSENPYFTAEDGVLYNKDKTELIRCPETKKSVTIPNSVTVIGDSAFYMCSSLTKISKPVNCTSIGENAFYGCTGLTVMAMPNKLTNIGSHAFSGCAGLKSVTLSGSVTSIGAWAFDGCTSLKSITIPKSVTKIGNYAFGYDLSSEMIDGFTIYGYSGSSAELYADHDGFTFIPLDGRVKINITLNTTDKTMSSQKVTINIDNSSTLISEDGTAELLLGDGIHRLTFSANSFVTLLCDVEVKNGNLVGPFAPKLNLIGDVNGDGKVDTLDIIRIKQILIHAINEYDLTRYEIDCANVNNDTTVDIFDIIRIKRHLINIEPLW